MIKTGNHTFDPKAVIGYELVPAKDAEERTAASMLMQDGTWKTSTYMSDPEPAVLVIRLPDGVAVHVTGDEEIARVEKLISEAH